MKADQMEALWCVRAKPSLVMVMTTFDSLAATQLKMKSRIRKVFISQALFWLEPLLFISQIQIGLQLLQDQQEQGCVSQIESVFVDVDRIFVNLQARATFIACKSKAIKSRPFRFSKLCTLPLPDTHGVYPNSIPNSVSTESSLKQIHLSYSQYQKTSSYYFLQYFLKPPS